ncbi:hypothetical protein [Spiribacter roseus]|uniref:hypothetical protein n=1 Tax=Spiribacter roseus TaxID=1855875 RepID=UPI00132F6A5A|nr:hypothetical protein [Spiribacter roseus]
MEEKGKAPAGNWRPNGDASNYRPSDLLLGKLDRVHPRGDGRWTACCPAHGDRSPSLSIREQTDGTLLIYCFAGCPAAAVLESVGLTLGDLFPDNAAERSPMRPGERWVPRDVLAAVAREALVALVGAETVARGDTLADADRDRLARAAATLRGAAREVGYDV